MVAFRSSRVSDAKTLGRTHVQAWQETYRGKISDDYLDWLKPEIAEQIFSHRAPANVFVAEDEGEIVGFAVVGHGGEEDMPPRTGELCGLYVLRSHQKKGIGKELFEMAEKRLSSLGYKRMLLWVLDTNLDAQAFYERMGMKKDGKYKHTTLGSVITEYRMVKEIK